MDTEASPEELDFEGINGRINKRHTQFRYFPDIGQDWNLAVALEEPDVVVQGGKRAQPDSRHRAERQAQRWRTAV